MPIRTGLIGFLILCSALASAQTAQPDIPKFTVSLYEVSGANPLSAEETAKLLEPYTGQHEGLEGLQAAADALEQSIRTRGYSFHRVVLPPQTLRAGIVQLQVIEFGLGRIEIENNRYFNDTNIRNSLPGLSEGQPPNVRQLARSLRLANQHPSKQVTLGFKESESAQAVDAVVKVEDRSPHSVFTVLQNTGSDETGDYRLSLGYQYSNLFNRDHSASVIYTTAPDDTSAVSQYGVSYRLPAYSISSAFSFAYSDSNIDSGLIDTGTNAQGDSSDFFSITGKGTAASLGYTYVFPSLGRYQHDLLVSYDDKLFENQLSFLGTPAPIPPECADANGRVRTNPLGMGYKGVFRSSNNVIGFSIGFHSNQANGSFSDDQAYACARLDADATSDWSATRYAMNFSQRFAGDWLFNFKLSGQAAGEPLVPGEQFGLGGAGSVRGYDERSILGDDGWQTSLELWTPAFAGNTANALLFYDAGHVKSEVAAGEPNEFDPAGVGLGLRWIWNNQLSLRTDVASALEEIDETEKGDVTVHFSIYYRF